MHEWFLKIYLLSKRVCFKINKSFVDENCKLVTYFESYLYIMSSYHFQLDSNCKVKCNFVHFHGWYRASKKEA